MVLNTFITRSHHHHPFLEFYHLVTLKLPMPPSYILTSKKIILISRFRVTQKSMIPILNPDYNLKLYTGLYYAAKVMIDVQVSGVETSGTDL